MSARGTATRQRTNGVRIAGAAILLGALATARNASADSVVTFVWEAPEECPSSADVQRRIAERIHDASLADCHVHARAVRDASGVSVSLATGSAERTILAPTCEAAADAVAVIVALSVDGGEAPERSSSPPPVPIVAAAENRQAERPMLAGGAPHETRARWRLSATGGVDSASLPAASPGVGLGGELRRGLLSGGLAFSTYLPQSARASGTSAVATTVGLVDVTAVACTLFPVGGGGSFEIGPCVGAGAGMFYATSEGVTNPDSGTGWRPQGTLFARGRVALSSSTALRIDAGLLGDPVRSPFHVGGVGDVYRPAAVSSRATAGIEWGP